MTSFAFASENKSNDLLNEKLETEIKAEVNENSSDKSSAPCRVRDCILETE